MGIASPLFTKTIEPAVTKLVQQSRFVPRVPVQAVAEAEPAAKPTPDRGEGRE
jgi:hypothetical protein